jgi:hypothetical protein
MEYPSPGTLKIKRFESQIIKKIFVEARTIKGSKQNKQKPLDQLCPREAEFKFNNNFVDRIYPIELEIKDTTDRSTSYLDLHLGISDKIDDLNFSLWKLSI